MEFECSYKYISIAACVELAIYLRVPPLYLEILRIAFLLKYRKNIESRRSSSLGLPWGCVDVCLIYRLLTLAL